MWSWLEGGRQVQGFKDRQSVLENLYSVKDISQCIGGCQIKAKRNLIGIVRKGASHLRLKILTYSLRTIYFLSYVNHACKSICMEKKKIFC